MDPEPDPKPKFVMKALALGGNLITAPLAPQH
jgi:hypothetical protein